jgi:adenosylcobinamide-GDP ribazoletransferase
VKWRPNGEPVSGSHQSVHGGARQALGFLTPLGGAATPTPGALAWFPVVGAGLGAVLGLLWWATARAWPPLVAAAIVVVADLALTGMLHFDGLVDSADGLLPHLAPGRRLEVMREPTVGAFGLGAGAAALVVRWSALAATRPSVLLLVGVWAASRSAMVLVIGVVPYARRDDGGLATSFTGARRAVPLIIGIVGILAGLGCTMAYRPLAGGVALGAGGVVGLGVVVLAVRRLGGYTGDVLGALGVALETTALAVAAARW